MRAARKHNFMWGQSAKLTLVGFDEPIFVTVRIDEDYQVQEDGEGPETRGAVIALTAIKTDLPRPLQQGDTVETPEQIYEVVDELAGTEAKQRVQLYEV